MIARIVEPTSIVDTGRVLTDLGVPPASEKTIRRTLTRMRVQGFRDQLASACFAHASTSGDVSLCLYEVTTLHFEAENEDELRKVGYSNFAEVRLMPMSSYRWWCASCSAAGAGMGRAA